MEAPVPVSVGWALWGKHPGTTRDYSVLASSNEPLSEAEFASVLGHFVPGTPPIEDTGRPGSLPWVTISRVGVANQAYLGISVVVPSDVVDATGRRASSTSYFCASYGDLSEPISYTSLYQELQQYIPPYQGLGLIQLSVPRLAPGALATAIADDFGEEAVRATAAMLLSGPVSVVGAENTTLLQRLLFLDAVAALLPYGYRAGGYTAATWSDSGTRHPIRLAFASRPRQNAGVVRWKSGPATPVDGPGRDYLELLRQVREQRADGESSLEQFARLISVLAQDRTPCGFDEPERAFAALNDFALPLVAYNSVRAGSGDPVLVRKVFAQRRETELTLGGRQELLAFLIETAHREPENWDAIDGCWDRVAGNDSSAMLPPMVKAVRGLLWRPSPAPNATTREYRELAVRHELIDALLAALVTVPAGPLADHRPGAQAVAQNLADSALGGASTAGFPQTRRALADSAFVASLLLAQVSSSARDLRTAVDWLEPALRQPLAAFFAVLGQRPHEISRHDITELASRDREYVVALLDAASAPDRLDLVLPGFADWLGRQLFARGSRDQEQAEYWRTRAMALRPVTPDTGVWLDLVLLLVGESPRYLLADRDRQSRRRYNQAAANAWADLAARLGPAGDDILTRALTDYLSQGQWAADSTRAAAVTALVERLTEDGQRPRLRAAIFDVLKPASRKPTYEVEPKPRSASASYGPASYEKQRAGQPGSRTSVETDPDLETRSRAAESAPPELRPGAAVADVAEFCISAFRGMRSVPDVIIELDQSHAIHSGSQAMAVLEELQRVLPSVPGRRDADAWLERLTRVFADGRLGQPAAEEFRRAAAQAAMEGISRHIAVLRIVIGRDEPAPPGWQDRDTDQLNQSIKSLEDIRGNVKSRSRLRSLLPGGRPHNANAEAEAEADQ